MFDIVGVMRALDFHLASTRTSLKQGVTSTEHQLSRSDERVRDYGRMKGLMQKLNELRN